MSHCGTWTPAVHHHLALDWLGWKSSDIVRAAAFRVCSGLLLRFVSISLRCARRLCEFRKLMRVKGETKKKHTPFFLSFFARSQDQRGLWHHFSSCYFRPPRPCPSALTSHRAETGRPSKGVQGLLLAGGSVSASPGCSRSVPETSVPPKRDVSVVNLGNGSYRFLVLRVTALPLPEAPSILRAIRRPHSPALLLPLQSDLWRPPAPSSCPWRGSDANFQAKQSGLLDQGEETKV
ncbi:hypothetical protein CSUI_010790 [Cystoisospora suis]|uniref:Uncharacterized protein n=1 Tax=Cystoisospora suis TaxID=483139 RepID=A0A2C6JW23_9APIC|nr:hypothetical protein CSUI_010790 [Cystoisospora suis]